MKHFTFEIYNDEAFDAACNRIGLDYHGTEVLVFHLFCAGEDKERCSEILGNINHRFPESVFCGVASNAELLEGRVTDPIPVLSCMIFEKSSAELLYEPDITNNARQKAEHFADIINERDDVKAVEVLICNTGNTTLDFIIGLEKIRRDIQVFGGMPLGHDMLGAPRYMISGGEITESGVICIIYMGRDLYVNTDYTAGWKALGKEFEITDGSSCTVRGINGQPPVEIYKKYLGITDNNDFSANTSEFPLLVRKGGGEMLRHPENTNPDGSITLDGYVETGMHARISYGDPETIIEDINRRCEALYDFAPEAVLLFSCTARKIFWGPFINNELAPFEAIAPMAGFCTGGEISRDEKSGEVMWHNVTLVSTGFREGERHNKGKAPKVNVDTVSGQTSLVKRLMNLVKETTKELEMMATMDELTGLYNRREIDRIINETSDIMSEKGQPVSYLMFDIDHFKKINDTYGHDIGDLVLRGVSEQIRNCAGENGGFAGRWGGEEFFLVLPEKSSDEAYRCAEGLRRAIADGSFDPVPHVTISIGVITEEPGKGFGPDKKEMFISVDNALYEAKNSGRNRTVVADK